MNKSLINLVTINPAILSVYPTQDKEVLLAAIETDAKTTFDILNSKANGVIDEAVKKDGTILRFATNFSKELCLNAVKENGNAIKYVPTTFLDDEIITEAIKSKSCAIRYISDFATTDQWIMALEDDLNNYRHITKKDITVLSYIAKHDPQCIINYFNIKDDINLEITLDEFETIIESIEGEATKKRVIDAYVDYMRDNCRDDLM